MQPACKLCRSFAASGFPTSAERGLAGSDAFGRDPDVCDACLGQDYARRPPWGVFEAFSLTLGLLVGTVAAAALVSRGFAPVAASRPLSFVAMAVAGSAAVAAAVWLLLHLIARVRTGSGVEDAGERAAEAERFYWLAVWASLTGRTGYKRRMLRRARASGFADGGRLSDARLGGVA